jgi:hypothetical protein
LKLCLLDANVVIYLHQLGLWGMILSRFEVFLASTVCAEALFWIDEQGQEQTIQLTAGTYTEISASATELIKLKEQFSGLQIDAGELESLAWLLSSRADEQCQTCSSDAVVFKVLGSMSESFRGTSLEELLQSIGDRRRVGYQYTKAFRERYAALGLSIVQQRG